jgi:hypothetical protein
VRFPRIRRRPNTGTTAHDDCTADDQRGEPGVSGFFLAKPLRAERGVVSPIGIEPLGNQQEGTDCA